MLTRRSTDIGGGPLPDDFEIREDGKTVGRVYKAVNVTSRPWVWFLTAQGVKAKNGAADTLEEALEAFKAAWELSRRDDSR